MRRILFAALGVVLLLLAYAGQDLATGAPTTRAASAQAAFPVVAVADQAKALRDLARAVDGLVEDRHVGNGVQSTPAGRRLIKAIVRQNAWMEKEADRIIADAHKIESAGAAQTTTQTVQQQIADIDAQIKALASKGSTLTREEMLELQRLYNHRNDLFTLYINMLRAAQSLTQSLTQNIA